MTVVPSSTIVLLLIFAAVFSLLAPFCTADDPARNVLYSGEVLHASQALTWGDFRFVMQDDCNLVLYEGSSQGLWTSQTNGRGRNCYVRLQRDGNLVLYSGGNKPLWKSDTASVIGAYVLVLQMDRNVVIYGGSRWSSGTTGLTHNSSARVYQQGSKYSRAEQPYNVLYPGDSMKANQRIYWGNYKFVMQSDCNLVLYDGGSQGLWTTGTNGKGANCYAAFGGDGNLAVYDGGNNRLWTTDNKWGEGNYVCILQQDRNIIIYGEARWATDTGNSNRLKIAMVSNE